MNGHLQSIIVDFNNTASKIYLKVFEEFSRSVQTLNRKVDNNVFKMQAAKYQEQLKKRLDVEAKNQMNTVPGSRDQVIKSLTSIINFYLQNFSRQSESL